MAGIMDARGDLVDDQLGRLAFALEHLHARARRHGRAPRRPCRQSSLASTAMRRAMRGRRAADGEDAVLMHVLDRIVEGERAVLTAHDDHRHLALEQRPGLRAAPARCRSPRARRRLVLAADRRLALAVIAEAARLEQRRRLDARRAPRADPPALSTRRKGRRNAEPADEILLGQAILRHGEGLGLGENRRAREPLRAPRPARSRTRRSPRRRRRRSARAPPHRCSCRPSSHAATSKAGTPASSE